MADSRIGKTRVLAFAAAMMVLLCSTSAHSRYVEHGEVATWFVYEEYHNESDEFLRCSVESSYNSGVYLFFGLNRNYQVEFEISHEDWVLTKGRSYPVQADVDDIETLNARVKPSHDQSLYVAPGNQQDFYLAITIGRILTVRANSQEFNFRLDGMNTAMSAAYLCVDDALAYEKRKTAGTLTEEQMPAPETSDHVDHDSLIYQVISGTIDTDAFGLSGLEIYEKPPENLLSIGYEMAWSGYDIIGAGATRPMEGIHISTAITGLSEYYEDNCPGEFIFKALEGKQMPGGTFSRSVLLQCDAQENGVTAVYSFLPVGETLFQIGHFKDAISDQPKTTDRHMVDAIIDLLTETLAEKEQDG